MKYRVFSMLVLVFALPLFAVSARADALSALALDNFAVLGASTVTNTGATTLGGNLGLYPGTSITGTGTITLSGAIDDTNGAAMTGQSDALAAYNELAGLPALSASSLSGTFGVGVYNFSSSALLSGALTLNFGGLNNQNIVFQIGSALTTASGSSVLIENAGTNDNVYWQVGSSAVLGTTTSFAGTIIALTSVSLDTGATDGCGSVIALNGAVTMQGNTISAGCSISTTGGTGGTPTGTVTPVVSGTTSTVYVPEPGTLGLLSFGLLGIVFLAFHKSRASLLI